MRIPICYEEGAEPEVIANNVQLILEAISNFSLEMPIIFCGVMPSSSQMSRPTEQIQAVNALYHKMLQNYPQATRLDAFSLFDNGEGNASLNEFPDLLHANELGYAKWTEALRPVFRQLELMM
jgi:lysophospholipase L1-like esterase